MDAPPADVTRLLLAWRRGDQAALEGLMPLVYAQLRALARRRMRAESPGVHTLQTTALVHEAYVRLVDGASVAWQDRTHFYAVCARVMRRVLVDRARARRAAKRAGEGTLVTLGDNHGAHLANQDDLVALDEALARLTRLDPRKSQVVELRYFGGLSLEETAEAIGTSVETVKRDWRTARIWLRRDLGLRRRDEEGIP